MVSIDGERGERKRGGRSTGWSQAESPAYRRVCSRGKPLVVTLPMSPFMKYNSYKRNTKRKNLQIWLRGTGAHSRTRTGVASQASGRQITSGKKKVVVVDPNLVSGGRHFILVDDLEKFCVHAYT